MCNSNDLKSKMAASMKKHAPIGRLVFETSSFNDEKEKHRKCISEHYFNSAIHILCPNVSVLPDELDNILSSQMSYLAKNVSLDLLLSMEFIEGFIKRGDVYMLSHGTCMESDDCVTLLPTGTLILHLTKDTFQELGLEGKVAKYGTTYICHDKHIVEIDLLNPKFFPEMKNYERVKWCLAERLDLNFDFLLSWKPHDAKVCPSSIQNYFQSNQSVCNRLKIPKKTTRYENFQVPIISSDVKPEGKRQKDSPKKYNGNMEDICMEQLDTPPSYMEVFEWLGACAAGAETSSSIDSYVSSYTVPTPHETLQYGTTLEFRGLITPDKVQRTVDLMRTVMQDKSLPWCCVTVHGFIDGPVTWQKQLHGFYNNGDNLYTLLMFNNGVYWIYKAFGGKDVIL